MTRARGRPKWGDSFFAPAVHIGAAFFDEKRDGSKLLLRVLVACAHISGDSHQRQVRVGAMLLQQAKYFRILQGGPPKVPSRSVFESRSVTDRQSHDVEGEFFAPIVI